MNLKTFLNLNPFQKTQKTRQPKHRVLIMEESFINIEGRKIFYRFFSSKSRSSLQEILILHGWGIDSSRFKELSQIISKNEFNVWAIDFPGFGKSELPNYPLSVSDYKEIVISFLKHKSIKKVSLLAHSFGGRVAIKLASENPEFVDKIILTGVPGIKTKNEFKKKVFKILSSFKKVFGDKDFMRKLLYRLAGSFDYYRLKGVMKETFLKVLDENLEEFLPKINQEVLLLWGEKDKIVPLKVAQSMNRKILNSRLEVIKSGTHKLPYENPDIFASYAIRFLKERTQSFLKKEL